MKLVICAAGASSYFPRPFDKPKCLYHYHGMVQLQRVIEDAKCIVEEKDIIVIAGYKAKKIESYLKENYPEITLRVNRDYSGPAINTLRVAAESIDDDIVFMFGDESISRENIRRIACSKKKMSILVHDTYYYYSLGIFKLRKDQLSTLWDDEYLSMDYMKKVYCFANQKDKYDGIFNINSGICIGYIIIDLVRRIAKIEKIEDPAYYTGEDVDFLHFDGSEYINDLDKIEQTEEFLSSRMLQIYTKMYFGIKKWIHDAPQKKIDRKIIKDFLKQCHKVYIYGTGEWGKKCYRRIASEHYNCVEAFIVTQKDGAEEQMGLPVIEAKNLSPERGDGFIIAIGNKYFDEVLKNVYELYGNETKVLQFNSHIRIINL